MISKCVFAHIDLDVADEFESNSFASANAEAASDDSRKSFGNRAKSRFVAATTVRTTTKQPFSQSY